MKPAIIKQAFAKTISQILEISEGMFGNHEQWIFYRKVLLKRLNELQREVQGEVEERKGDTNGSRDIQDN